MLRKILLAVLLTVGYSAYAQFPNSISTAQLPTAEGMILDVVDYNNDGYEDVVYQSGLSGKIQLYKNTRGVFTDVTAFVGLPTDIGGHGDGSEGVVSFDYNNDGFQDLLVARSGASSYFRLFKNLCGSGYTEVTGLVNLPASPNLFAQYLSKDPLMMATDIDRDNDIDLVYLESNTGSGDIHVLTNNGGTFLNPSSLINNAGDTILNFAIIDFNADFADDILLVKNTGYGNSCQIELYENNGGGVFTIPSSPAVTGFTNSSPVGFANVFDYNADGFPDVLLGTKEVVAPGPGNQKCKLFRNNGNYSFTDMTASYDTYTTTDTGDFYNSHVFDLDNDGDLDVLWEINRNSKSTSRPALMRNNGLNVFSNVRGTYLPLDSISTNHTARYFVFDYNHDGALDIFVPGTGSTPAALYRNTFTAPRFLGVKLFSCNNPIDPITARIKVRDGALTNVFKTYSAQGMSSSNPGKSETMYFGLGNLPASATVDSVTIYWPNGMVDFYFDLPVDSVITFYNGVCDPLPGRPLVFDLGPDTIVFCNQTTGLLLAPGGYANYTWRSGPSTADYTVTQAGWYFCTGTTVDGCFGSDSIYVGFSRGKIVEPDTTVCPGTSLTFTASPRFDCSPFGAPKRRTIKAGDAIPGLTYINSLDGHHYYLFNSNSTWSAAESTAVSLGGHLVVINSQPENDFITAQPALTGANLWIGLYRDTTAGSPFRWVNCEDTTFMNWAPTAAPVAGKFNNKVYLRNGSCIDGTKWLNTDESASLPDPCESNFFGLVEFDPSYNITYKWSNGDTTVSSSFVFTNPNFATVEVKSNGLTCMATVNVNVVDANNQIAQDSINECKASFISISAAPGMASYKWNTIPVRTTQSIFVSTFGSNRWYRVNVVTPEGCTGVDSVFVSINNAAIKTPDTTVCLGSTVFLRGPSPAYEFMGDYAEPFSGPGPWANWSSGNKISYNGSNVLGPFADKTNDSITYSMLGLGVHDSIRVTFDLYIHDTWEGNCSLVGPDIFRFNQGTSNVLNTTFSNRAGCTQNYPTTGSPAFTGAAATGLPRRCDLTGSTTKYTITRTFRHTATDLYLSWVSDLKDSVDNTNKCNESWTLDNVVIEVRRPGKILWSTGDTVQNIYVTINDTLQTYWVEVPVQGGFCYDSVTVRAVTGKLDGRMFIPDTLRYCGSPSALVYMPANFDTYVWSTGATTRSTTIFNEGWYGGYAATATGCYNLDSVFISIGKSVITPTNDTTICSGNPISFSIDLKNGCSAYGSPANTGYVALQTIPGYTYIGEYHGHYYYLSDTRSSWTAAAQSAVTSGGHLACINDQFEQDFIANSTDSNVWLGLYNDATKGYYQWMNCDTMIYSNWATSEPTASPNDYAFMMKAGCPEAKKWAAHTDDDLSSPDPCYSNIYGLLEIVPNTYVFDWWLNGVSTYNTPTIFINPSADVTVSALVQAYPGGGNCGAGNVRITVIDEGFGIIPDSVTKLGCTGDTAMIEARPGFSNYHWDNGDTNQIAVYSNIVGWAFCMYDNGTCQFRDSVYLSIPGKLTTTPSITNITCYGANDGIGNAGFTGGLPPVNVLWLHNGSTNAAEPALSPGTYYYVVTDAQGCSATDSVVITNPASPLSLSFTTLNPILCNGDSNAKVVPVITGGESPYTGSWIGSGAPDTLFNAFAGIYTYTVTDARGCTITKDDTLTDPAILDIIATQLKQIRCADDSNGIMVFAATGGTTPYTYLWNTNVLSSDTAYDVFYGNSYAIVIDKNGCMDTASFFMDASNPELCGIVVSSGFTPNNDGMNDVLVIRGLALYPDNELTVFNRWGESVYHAMNYKNDWDGKPSSKIFGATDELVPNDTYFYVLVTKSNNKTYTGYIYITK